MSLASCVAYAKATGWYALVEDVWNVACCPLHPNPPVLRAFIRIPEESGWCNFGRGSLARWPDDAIHFTALTFPG